MPYVSQVCIEAPDGLFLDDECQSCLIVHLVSCSNPSVKKSMDELKQTADSIRERWALPSFLDVHLCAYIGKPVQPQTNQVPCPSMRMLDICSVGSCKTFLHHAGQRVQLRVCRRPPVHQRRQPGQLRSRCAIFSSILLLTGLCLANGHCSICLLVGQ